MKTRASAPTEFLPYRLRIRALEAFSATLALYWGVVLLVPGDTFAASPSYKIMAALGSEASWAAFYLIVGAVQWAGIRTRSRWLRPLGLHLAIIAWGFASVMLLMSNPYTHAPGIYGILALSQIAGAVWCRT